MLSSGYQEGRSIPVKFLSGNDESIQNTTITEPSTSITRSTSPIDGRIIRLLLGEIVEGNFTADAAQLDEKRRNLKKVTPTNTKSRSAVKSSPSVVARVDCIRSPKNASFSNEASFRKKNFTGRALQHDGFSSDRVSNDSSATLLQNSASKSHVVDLLLSKIQVLKHCLI